LQPASPPPLELPVPPPEPLEPPELLDPLLAELPVGTGSGDPPELLVDVPELPFPELPLEGLVPASIPPLEDAPTLPPHAMSVPSDPKRASTHEDETRLIPRG
jgi:hypothetical protein